MIFLLLAVAIGSLGAGIFIGKGLSNKSNLDQERKLQSREEAVKEKEQKLKEEADFIVREAKIDLFRP